MSSIYVKKLEEGRHSLYGGLGMSHRNSVEERKRHSNELSVTNSVERSASGRTRYDIKFAHSVAWIDASEMIQ